MTAVPTSAMPTTAAMTVVRRERREGVGGPGGSPAADPSGDWAAAGVASGGGTWGSIPVLLSGSTCDVAALSTLPARKDSEEP